MGDVPVTERAAKALIVAFKDMKPRDEVPTVPLDAPFYQRVSPSGEHYCYSKAGHRAIEAAAKAVVTDLGGYPAGSATQKLLTIVLSAKDSGVTLPALAGHFAPQIGALIQQLKSLGDWELLAVVSGIDMQGGPIEIGDCRFFVMRQSEYQQLRNRFVSGKPDYVARNWEHWESAPIGAIRSAMGECLGSARVRAADSSHAQSLGLDGLQQCLNAWCYGQVVTIGFREPFPFIRLKGEALKGRLAFCLRHDVPDMGAQMGPYGFEGTSPMIVTTSPGWESIGAILRKPFSQRSELESRLLVAVEWVANAAYSEADSVRLVSLATALEALFILAGESKAKKAKLIERISWLLGCDTKDRRVVGADVASVYSARSDCVHAGQTYVEPETLDTARQLVGRCIERLTSNGPFSAMTDLNQFVDWVVSNRPAPSSLGAKPPYQTEPIVPGKWYLSELPQMSRFAEV